MKPRELILLRLEEYIIPFMAGQGFRFLKSSLAFKRSTAKVKHEIDVCLDRNNFEDNCSFWTMWSASAPEYLVWHKKEWNDDERALGDTLGSLGDWKIPGWPSARRTLVNTDADAGVMTSFRSDIERVGLPFLARISTWEGAAELCRKERWKYDMAADFLLIAGKRESAREVIIEGIHAFEAEGRNDTFGELPKLKRRLQRYFGM